MKAICPHCHQGIEIAPDVFESLRGQTHFKCPACSGDIEVPTATARRPVTLATGPSPVAGPRPPGTPAPSGPRGGAAALTSVQRGLNRNLLVLGSLTLLTLGGLGVFITSRNRGNTQVTEQNIFNEIIQNSYFTKLIASGATTEKDLNAVADIRPYGNGFIGISKEMLSWEQAQDLALRTGAEILSVEDPSATQNDGLIKWLTETFKTTVPPSAWMQEGGEARVLIGSEILAANDSNRMRRALLHWQASAERNFLAAIEGKWFDGSAYWEIQSNGTAFWHGASGALLSSGKLTIIDQNSAKFIGNFHGNNIVRFLQFSEDFSSFSEEVTKGTPGKIYQRK